MTQLSDFLDKFLAPATASHAKFYPRGPFVSISLAQTIIESAWGQRTAGTNNYWGIKANAAQIAAGAYTTLMTHETIKGQYVKIPQHFANYPTLEAGFDAHAYLLTTPHYERCINACDPDEYAHALLACGYATGIPGHPYDEALISIMRSNDLYAYNSGTPKIETMVSDKPKPTLAGWYWIRSSRIGDFDWHPAYQGNDGLFRTDTGAVITNILIGPAIPRPPIPTPTTTTTTTPN